MLARILQLLGDLIKEKKKSRNQIRFFQVDSEEYYSQHFIGIDFLQFGIYYISGPQFTGSFFIFLSVLQHFHWQKWMNFLPTKEGSLLMLLLYVVVPFLQKSFSFSTFDSCHSELQLLIHISRFI